MSWQGQYEIKMSGRVELLPGNSSGYIANALDDILLDRKDNSTVDHQADFLFMLKSFVQFLLAQRSWKTNEWARCGQTVDESFLTWRLPWIRCATRMWILQRRLMRKFKKWTRAYEGSYVQQIKPRTRTTTIYCCTQAARQRCGQHCNISLGNDKGNSQKKMIHRQVQENQPDTSKTQEAVKTWRDVPYTLKTSSNQMCNHHIGPNEMLPPSNIPSEGWKYQFIWLVSGILVWLIVVMFSIFFSNLSNLMSKVITKPSRVGLPL